MLQAAWVASLARALIECPIGQPPSHITRYRDATRRDATRRDAEEQHHSRSAKLFSLCSFCSFCFSLAASPDVRSEFAKVASQTNQSWSLRQCYSGFSMQWVRTWGVMSTYFCLIDSTRRHYPGAFSNPLGQFAVSAGSATLGFWIVWPFEASQSSCITPSSRARE